MAEEKLLTVREVSVILGISEKEVVDLAEKGDIPAYKIGGVYLRFKKEQIRELQKSNNQILSNAALPQEDTFMDKAKDFFYFNDFYVITVFIIGFLLFIIFRGI